MEKDIKRLRVRLDAIGQLTRSLYKGIHIDLASIPKGLTTEQFLEEWEKQSPQIASVRAFSAPFHSKGFVQDAHKDILLSKAALGKVLGALGETTPYKNDGKRKTVEDIETTADQSNLEEEYPGTIESWKKLETPVEKLDFLRQVINMVVNDIRPLKWESLRTDTLTRDEVHLWLTEAYTKACYARINLGFELGELKEHNKVN